MRRIEILDAVCHPSTFFVMWWKVLCNIHFVYVSGMAIGVCNMMIVDCWLLLKCLYDLPLQRSFVSCCSANYISCISMAVTFYPARDTIPFETVENEGFRKLLVVDLWDTQVWHDIWFFATASNLWLSHTSEPYSAIHTFRDWKLCHASQNCIE